MRGRPLLLLAAASLALTCVCAYAAIEDGLIGHWKFDEGSGTVAGDSSIANLPGAITGDIIWSTGVNGGAIAFDGINDRVSVNNFAGINTYTYSLWVKANNIGASYQHFLSQDVGNGNPCHYFRYYISSKRLELLGQIGGSISVTYDLNSWTHIIAVNDEAANQSRLYINGVLAGTSTAMFPSSDQPFNNRLGIGEHIYPTYSTDFNGKIDDVRIYNRVLSESEILQLYQLFGEVTDTDPPTIAYHYPRVTTLPKGVTTATLAFKTDEPATAKFSMVAGLPYDSMIDVFQTTGGVWHYTVLTNLIAGQPYSYYIKTKDPQGYANTEDYTITFSIEEGQPEPLADLAGNDFFAAPGIITAPNDFTAGTLQHPWDLQTAVRNNIDGVTKAKIGLNAAVKEGDHIWLRGGTYQGEFVTGLQGTVDKPIIVRAYPKEQPVIDGDQKMPVISELPTMTVNGQYIWLWGLEIMDSNPKRVLAMTGSGPSDAAKATGLNVYAPGAKLINLVIHDNAQGIGAWSPASDSEYYGNVIFNNGWLAPDRGHGHGMYVQNQNGGKLFKDNIVIHNFGETIQMYGSDSAYLNNMTWERNIWANKRVLFGGNTPINRLVLKDNFSYKVDLQVGYGSRYNNDIEITNNYFANRLTLALSKNVRVTDNTIINNATVISLRYSALPDNPVSDYAFDRNTYYMPYISPGHSFYITLCPIAGSSVFWWFNKSMRGYGYVRDAFGNPAPASWQEDLGYDPHGTHVSAMPTGAKIFFNKNQYDPARANTAIYNWNKADSVGIPASDIAQVLSAGDTYELHSVLDYYGDVVKGTYTGGDMNVSMINHTVAKPIGYDQTLGPTTFPEFGAFVLIKTSGAIAATILYGDVSGNGEVTAYDASLVAQHAVSLITLTSEQMMRANVSGSGGVSSYDASLIAQRAVGMITQFPVEG